MLIKAKLECDKDHIPYRIYINGELMTERYYTIATPKTISNDFTIQLEDADTYDFKLENLSDTEVKLVDYNIIKEEVQNEDT